MKFSLSSFGCTMNQGEGEIFRRRLISAGHVQIDHHGQTRNDGTDVNILFTCIVIQETERRMLKMVQELSQNGIPLIVAGCLATTLPDRVREIAPDTLLIPPRDLVSMDIGEIEQWVEKRTNTYPSSPPPTSPSDDSIPDPSLHDSIPDFPPDPFVPASPQDPSVPASPQDPSDPAPPQDPSEPSPGDILQKIELESPTPGSPPDQMPHWLSWYNENEIFSSHTQNSSIEDRTTFILPISQGCLGNCAYCLTKHARGTLSSYDPEDIRSMAQKAIAQGRTEIQITSQDTAIYGRDIAAGTTSLPSLLDSISAIEGDFRIRVGMMNPTWMLPILPELIRSYRLDKVYSFLHMPIQSGDDAILKAMRRGYTVDDVRRIISAFRAEIPDLTLSTDIITGFPGEDDRSFDRTMAIIEELSPDIVNITRYSERPGTEAVGMSNKVHGRISKERSRRLTELRFRISARKNASLIGKHLVVLVTERGKGETVISRDENYRSIVIKSTLPPGTWHTVEIIGSTDVYLIGKKI